jgi:mannosyltransferase OCH1-like enzyme
MWKRNLPKAAARQKKPDYDYAAAKEAGVKPDSAGHLPDTYKLPNHITFSTESRYSTPEHRGGVWKDLNEGKPGKKQLWMYTPSKWVLSQHSRKELEEYFRDYEGKETDEHLPSILVIPAEPK